MNVRANARVGFVGTAAATVAGAVVMLVSEPALATKEYAAQTGKPCAQCHVYPTGDSRLTPFGKAFAANDYKLPVEVPLPKAAPVPPQ